MSSNMFSSANATAVWPTSTILSATSLNYKDAITLLILPCFTWNSLWKWLCLVLIVANFKNFPFIYHLRFLNALRFVIQSQRPTKVLGPAQIFQPMITSSRAPLMEIDVIGHKSNSTYFTDIDVARIHLMMTLFSKAIEQIRGSTTMNGLSGKSRTVFSMPLGAVSCVFHRELKPYQPYDMWTRILSWDDKWFYIVTHFVPQSAQLEPIEYVLYPWQKKQNEKQNGKHSAKTRPVESFAYASALSKVVFKNSRKTMKPEFMLEAAGLLPRSAQGQTTAAASISLSTEGSAIQSNGPISHTRSRHRLQKGYGSKSLAVCTEESSDEPSVKWTRERVEIERQRGMLQARLLAQQSDLNTELNYETALGRHYDGFGIEGVVATLAQLGKISKYQLV